MPRLLLVAFLGLIVVAGPARGGEPELDRLQQHVTTLASPEFGGRRDAGAIKARDHLLAEFRRLGLAPLFGDSYRQEITAGTDPGAIGVNVGAKLEATDPGLAGQWIILGVHYDHLGTRDGVVFPGADDNASGVAMMLEVARCFVESPGGPRRGVMFVGFDLEERGLVGSQFFVTHPPVPLEQVRLFITADMIGRSLAGLFPEDVFVMGSEREPAVRPWIERSAAGQPVRVNLIGSDVLIVDRSDYGPFRLREIPYLFFSTGESRVYHSARDVAATLDYPKLAAVSRVMNGVVRTAAEAATLPAWSARPDHPVAEAVAYRRVFATLLEHRDDLKLNAYQLTLIRTALRTAEGVEARGSMTDAERTVIIRTAQVALSTAL